LAQSFRVTHPFHPLRGREFALVDRRSAWGEDRVYFRDEAGELKRMPIGWTSLGAVDAFVAVPAGRSSLRVQDLLQLVALAERLRAARGSQKAKRKR
jgi:hypothetical protein